MTIFVISYYLCYILPHARGSILKGVDLTLMETRSYRWEALHCRQLAGLDVKKYDWPVLHFVCVFGCFLLFCYFLFPTFSLNHIHLRNFPFLIVSRLAHSKQVHFSLSSIHPSKHTLGPDTDRV